MGDDKGGGANSGAAMAKSVDMLEQLLDSGAVGPEDLDSLKEMLSQSIGMPVEEMLERKEELQKEMPPEATKLFDLIERLFDQKQAAPKSKAKAAPAPPGADLDDENVKVTVRPKARPA